METTSQHDRLVHNATTAMFNKRPFFDNDWFNKCAFTEYKQNLLALQTVLNGKK